MIGSGHSRLLYGNRHFLFVQMMGLIAFIQVFIGVVRASGVAEFSDVGPYSFDAKPCKEPAARGLPKTLLANIKDKDGEKGYENYLTEAIITFDFNEDGWCDRILIQEFSIAGKYRALGNQLSNAEGSWLK